MDALKVYDLYEISRFLYDEDHVNFCKAVDIDPSVSNLTPKYIIPHLMYLYSWMGIGFVDRLRPKVDVSPLSQQIDFQKSLSLGISSLVIEDTEDVESYKHVVAMIRESWKHIYVGWLMQNRPKFMSICLMEFWDIMCRVDRLYMVSWAPLHWFDRNADKLDKSLMLLSNPDFCANIEYLKRYDSLINWADYAIVDVPKDYLLTIADRLPWTAISSEFNELMKLLGREYHEFAKTFEIYFDKSVMPRAWHILFRRADEYTVRNYA